MPRAAFAATPPIVSWTRADYGRLSISLVKTGFVGLTVFALAWVNLAMTRRSGGPPAMWSADAFVLFCLLRSPYRRWPAISIATWLGLIASSRLYIPLPVIAGTTVFGTTGVVVCAAVLRRLCGRRIDLSQPRTLIIFGIVAVGGPALSSIILRVVLALFGVRMSMHGMTIWFCGHALGYLVITPVLLALRPRTLKRILAAPLDIALLASFTVALFILFNQSLIPPQPAIIAMIVLITFRMEQAGAAISASLTAVVAMGFMLAAARGHGDTDITSALLAKQISLAITTGCALAIGATLAHRRRLRASLKMSLASAEAARTEAIEAMRRSQMAEQVAGVGFWRVELFPMKITWSPEMYRIWGLDASQLPGLRTCLKLIHPEDRPMARQNMRRIMTELVDSFGTPVRLLFPDGSIRYLTGRVGADRDADGRIVALHGALLDVTNLKLADEAVRTSEARYRLLADHSNDVIIRSDLQGRILYVSPSCRSLGFSPEEMIGGWRRDLIHPDDVASQLRRRDALLAGAVNPRDDREHRHFTKDGGLVWMESSAALIRDETGAPSEIISQLRDITERKAFEAELVAARDAAEAGARAKSEFLANMSHEIRTPLTAIIGFAGLLTESGDQMSEQAHRYAQRVATAGQSLLSVVNDILDFSKLEAGQVQLDPHPFDPAAYVEDTVELLSAQAEAKGLALGLIIDDSVPDRIDADSSRLRQVLLNLIGNAIKFTGEGRVSVSMSHSQGQLRVRIADTGLGIPAERRDRLFQRFSQVDGSVSRNHGGTGLGLAICKSLVTLMGGEIGVDSEKDKGSVFWFSIAAAPCEVGAGLTAVAANYDQRACRILVTDDVNANRELVRAMLEPLGHTFVEAQSGAEAIEAAERETFDLILMDLQMPGMDGYAASRAIRSSGGFNSLTPIVALSANVLPDHLEACAAAGMDDHVGKPIQPMRLLTKIAEWAHERHTPRVEALKSA